ncbi:acyl-CoA synthetase, putative, partial [Ixodes scapularis]
RNFGAFMVAKLEAHPKSRFVNGSSHESWSYAQVAGQARAVCRGLRRLGLGRGCTAYLLSNSRAELVPALFGAACANVAVAYEQPDYGVDVLVDMLEPLRPDAVLCEHSALNKVLQVQERLSCVKVSIAYKSLSPDNVNIPLLEYLVSAKPSIPIGFSASALISSEMETYDWWQLCATLFDRRPIFQLPESSEGRLNCGLKHQHPDQLSLGEEDVLVCTSVLGHVYACFDCVCKGIVQGASTVFLEYKASIEALLEALQKHRATALCTVPFVAQQLLAYQHLDRYDLSSLRHLTTATSYISPDISK